MEYYFDTDDKLGRRKYAEFLKSMLENCDKYRREDSDGAYVIAIDSPWGTGKTRFAKMLRNFLEGREPRVIDGKADQSFIPSPKEDRKFNVIYYNSWETDYWGDALEPLIHNVLNSELFELVRADKDCDDVTNKLLRATKGVLKAVGLGFARNIIGDAAAEVIKGTIDEINTKDPDPLAAYSESIKMYNQFKEALAQTIEQTGRKLVIIVDELDRCRPIFAIQTLELVKHLFAVKGLVFVFSLDVKQLGCSVRTVYGHDLDATGYLGRFFDYSVKLPAKDIRAFIETLLVKIDTKSIFKRLYKEHDGVDSRTAFIDFVYDLSEKTALSLRDLTTVFETYHLMIDTFLNEYHSLEAIKLYFLILVIKYKYLELFKGLFFGKSITEEASSYFKRHLGFDLDFKLRSKLMMIYDSKAISSRAFRLAGSNGENLGGGMTINSVSGDENNFTVAWNLGESYQKQTQKVNYRQECIFDGILYIQDIIKWEEIRHLTLAQYYHQQLEMFNFALPADAPETDA